MKEILARLKLARHRARDGSGQVYIQAPERLTWMAVTVRPRGEGLRQAPPAASSASVLQKRGRTLCQPRRRIHEVGRFVGRTEAGIAAGRRGVFCFPLDARRGEGAGPTIREHWPGGFGQRADLGVGDNPNRGGPRVSHPGERDGSGSDDAKTPPVSVIHTREGSAVGPACAI
jgi:hypothetical protein